MTSRAARAGILTVAVVAAVANANFLLAGPLGSPLDLYREVLARAGRPGRTPLLAVAEPSIG